MRVPIWLVAVCIIICAVLASALDDLPCCPATCPQCVSSKKGETQRRPFHRADDSIVEVPIRRRRHGHHLQKAGELLKDEPDAGYVVEKGQLRPVLLDEAADFFRQDLWLPTGGPNRGRVECKDDNCPCFRCKCCYTETFLCTVTEKCVATVRDTIIKTMTVTRTSAARSTVSVTAFITFTADNEVFFRSTETFTEFIGSSLTFTDAIETTTITSRFPIYRTTTTFQASFGTSFITLSDPLFTITELVDGILTETISSGLISINEGEIFLEATVTEISTIASVVPFTVLGPDPTITSSIPLTLKRTATLPPAQVTLTPTLTVATLSTTETITRTSTSTERECTGVETVRKQATRTIVRRIGTATPSPAPPCGPRCPH